MKKVILLATILLLATNCKKEDKIICQTPPPVFSLLINKNSEIYKEFIDKERNIDRPRISMYKLNNNNKEKFNIFFNNDYTSSSNATYLKIGTQLWFTNDIYTGKTETLYLENAIKTYKIEVNGYMKKTECGEVSQINEILVDGVKIKDYYLAE